MEEVAEIRKRTDNVGVSLRPLGNVYFLLRTLYTFLTTWVCVMLTVVVAHRSVRWKYDLYDNIFGQERAWRVKSQEEFSMSAVDMSMIDHIPDMIENMVWTVWNQRVEWSLPLLIHYVSTVSNWRVLQGRQLCHCLFGKVKIWETIAGLDW